MRRNIGMRISGHRIRIMVMMCSTAVAMGVMICAAIAQTIGNLAGERIGEMAVMMRVFQAIHQRDVRLP